MNTLSIGSQPYPVTPSLGTTNQHASLHEEIKQLIFQLEFNQALELMDQIPAEEKPVIIQEITNFSGELVERCSMEQFVKLVNRLHLCQNDSSIFISIVFNLIDAEKPFQARFFVLACLKQHGVGVIEVSQLHESSLSDVRKHCLKKIAQDCATDGYIDLARDLSSFLGEDKYQVYASIAERFLKKKNYDKADRYINLIIQECRNNDLLSECLLSFYETLFVLKETNKITDLIRIWPEQAQTLELKISEAYRKVLSGQILDGLRELNNLYAEYSFDQKKIILTIRFLLKYNETEREIENTQLEEAINWFRRLTNSEEKNLISRILTEFICNNRGIQEAKNFIESLSDEQEFAKQGLVREMVKQSYYEEAKEVTDTMKEGIEKDIAVALIIKSKLGQVRVEEDQSYISSSIKNDHISRSLHAKLALITAQEDQKEKTLELANQLNEGTINERMCSIALTYSINGVCLFGLHNIIQLMEGDNFEKVLSSSSQELLAFDSLVSDKNTALRQIASFWAGKEKFEQAQEAASLITNQYDREYALYLIACQFAFKSHLDEVKEIIDSLKFSTFENTAKTIYAVFLIKEKRYREATQVLDTIPETLFSEAKINIAVEELVHLLSSESLQNQMASILKDFFMKTLSSLPPKRSLLACIPRL